MVVTVSTESIEGEKVGRSGYSSSVDKSQKPSKVGTTEQVIKASSFTTRPGITVQAETKQIEEGTIFYVKKVYVNFNREVRFFYGVSKYHYAYNPQTHEIRTIDIEAITTGRARGGIVISDINNPIKNTRERVYGPPWEETLAFTISVRLMSGIPGTGVGAIYGFEEPI